MRRHLTLAVLLLASAASAALPDALVATLADLKARSQAYVEGKVSYDGELEGRLDGLKAQLDAIAAALPDSDTRKRRVTELAAETGRLKQRSMRPGTRYGQIGREVKAHVDDIEALDRPVAPRPNQLPGQRSDLRAQLEARSAAALDLGSAIAGHETFAMRDAVAAPRATAAAALPARVPVPPVKPEPPAEPPLSINTRNPRVNVLQEELNLVRRALGQRIIKVDGDFGPQTKAAVIAFQRGVGLKQTGVVDDDTSLELFRAATSVRGRETQFVQIGDDGKGVEDVQDMLNRVAGYRIVGTDGDFGGGTQRAVRAFQRANHLEPHGHVDEKTLNALRAASAGKPPVASGRRLMPPGPVPDLYTSPRMPADVSALIAEAEKEFGITPNLFRALVWAEGGALGNSAVARGPAQITESGSWGCRQLGYKWRQIRDEKKPNIRCGAYIFANRPIEYGVASDASPFIAASLYNTVAKHWPRIVRENKVPPFVETTSYVTRISRMYCQYTGVRLLVPNRDLHQRMLPLSKRVDRDMVEEFALEGREPRPGCSPY